MAFPETHGNVVERLAQLQQELSSWANPLGSLNALRWAVVELIDIVEQLANQAPKHDPRYPEEG